MNDLHILLDRQPFVQAIWAFFLIVSLYLVIDLGQAVRRRVRVWRASRYYQKVVAMDLKRRQQLSALARMGGR